MSRSDWETPWCDWGGGNDYLACRRCGAEYDYRKRDSVRPPCQRAQKIAELRDRLRQVQAALAELGA